MWVTEAEHLKLNQSKESPLFVCVTSAKFDWLVIFFISFIVLIEQMVKQTGQQLCRTILHSLQAPDLAFGWCDYVRTLWPKKCFYNPDVSWWTMDRLTMAMGGGYCQGPKNTMNSDDHGVNTHKMLKLLWFSQGQIALHSRREGRSACCAILNTTIVVEHRADFTSTQLA